MIEGYIIGVDIGGTNIRIGADGGDGKLEKFQKISSRSILTGEDSVENLVTFLKDYISEHLKGEAVKAIAIGFPSTLNKERNVVVQTPNINGLDHVPLEDILKEALGIPVYLERDVNMLFCNDMRHFHLGRQGIHIGVYVGTGIGNAIFINGAPYVGKNGAAGELGHIPTGLGKDPCTCGNEGCAECYASGRHLVELRDTCFPETSIEDLFVEHADDPRVKEFVDCIAGVIAAEITILDPETIVIGGGVINMKSFPRTYLELAIHKYVRKPYPEQNLVIHYSVDAVENGVKGAILYAQEKQNLMLTQENYRMKAC